MVHRRRYAGIGLVLSLMVVRLAAAGLMEQANERYNEGKVHEAIELYRKAAIEGENPALCYFNMANAYFQLDSLPQSIVYYRACVNYAPDFFRAYLNLAMAYYRLEEIGPCVAVARRALELEPTDEKALTILGASYRRAGAYPEAVATFHQLASLYPQNEEAPVQLGEMYRELEDDEIAIAWFLRYPEGGENEAYAKRQLADIYESRGDLERAHFYLRKAYEMDSSNKWVYYQMVMLQQRMGNEMVALDQARRGLEGMGGFAELALLAGNLAFGLEKYNEAERFYLMAREQGSAGAVVGLENIRIVRMGNSQDVPE